MKWFRKKEGKEGHRHLIIEKTLALFNRKLRQAAAFLQRKTARYSARKMKTLLALLCLFFLTGSVVVAVEGFQTKAALSPVPAMRFLPLLKENPQPQAVPVKVLERIHRFKRYLDSLGLTERGQVQRDSLLRSRPHLMDTLYRLDRLYTNE